jgi:hypothetical protein
MKTSLPRRAADHDSYRLHRRQVWWQIVLPVLVAALALLAAPIIAWQLSFGGAGDVGRWAAISSMWLLIPVIFGGAILLAAVCALIFVTVRINSWVPTFSYRAQRFAARAADGALRASEIVRRPVLAVKGLGTLARTGFKRLRGGA